MVHLSNEKKNIDYVRKVCPIVTDETEISNKISNATKDFCFWVGLTFVFGPRSYKYLFELDRGKPMTSLSEFVSILIARLAAVHTTGVRKELNFCWND